MMQLLTESVVIRSKTSFVILNGCTVTLMKEDGLHSHCVEGELRRSGDEAAPTATLVKQDGFVTFAIKMGDSSSL